MNKAERKRRKRARHAERDHNKIDARRRRRVELHAWTVRMAQLGLPRTIQDFEQWRRVSARLATSLNDT